jgi:hypothetical protein
MSLTTPLSVQKLQTALHDKAKGSPKFRFYVLYDKVYREDVMAFAYECCTANRGAAGVDGQTFEDIEEYGVQKWLDELTQELKSRTNRPQPAIKDRVAQTAAVLVLEPIFEADLQPEQYAYRPHRSALDLHALGSTYKESPLHGLLIVITADPAKDVAIPGADYTFGDLQLALALREFEALEQAEKRASYGCTCLNLGKTV